MHLNNEENSRTQNFKRNSALEELLTEINDLMHIPEQKLLNLQEPKHPIIFLMGPHRSGSTLLMQWIANTGIFAYPTNLLSRFYKAPILGSKIQLMLTDEKYNFRNEIRDFNNAINFESENGKTKGALSPNEFYYFWRRFLPFGEIDYLTNEELFNKVDIGTLKAEFAGMIDTFDKPFALKGMMLNYNIPFLNKIFEKSIFIYVKRESLSNIESALQAREKQFGSISKWYSFRIPEYYELKKMDPYKQVAGQIYYINKAIKEGLKCVAGHKKMTICYEDFCNDPSKYYYKLVDRLAKNGFKTQQEYKLTNRFKTTRKRLTNINIINAYRYFVKRVTL